MTGKFIVLEGVDGAGTTTQAKAIGEALAARGIASLVTGEPSTGAIGKKIRELLKSASARAVDQREMARLFAEDRMDHLKREIEPALAAGTHVICDRYVLSSYVYQSRFVELGYVRGLNAQAPPADLTLLLRVSAEVAESRRKGRGAGEEMYERLALQRKFVAAYDALDAADARREHLVVVDGTRPIDEVRSALLARVESCLAGAAGSSS